VFVVDLKMLEIVEDSHFVVGFVCGRIFEEVEDFHGGQSL
jgi:hypothetical protein